LLSTLLWSTPGEIQNHGTVFISPKLVFGVWVPYQARNVRGKGLYWTVTMRWLPLGFIITEDFFLMISGSAGASLE
jgi:hypothetical protein